MNTNHRSFLLPKLPQSSMTNQQHQLEYEAAEILEMLEDMVEYVCKEHTISG